MEKTITFAIDDLQKIDFNSFSNEEFAIAHMGFLSTKPNSHGLKISEEVLRESAPSVLGKWVVADMTMGYDAGTHTPQEKIVGIIPKDQSVEFVRDKDGYLRAYVDTVISKIYGKDFCNIFANDNNRAVSVEMKVATDMDDEDLVLAFNIVGVTALGKEVRPSCPDSDIEFVRFSEVEAKEFFKKTQKSSADVLKNFMKERNVLMAKTYKVDKSKEAMSNKNWGDVDKTELRNKIMEADNRASLVKQVYMLVEDGWEDAPSEHLKYPVMCFEGDKLVYNRGGLSSALGYAKAEGEQSVVNKVEKIYKKLDLDDSDGKEEKDMSEKETAFAEEEKEEKEAEAEAKEAEEEKEEKMAEEESEGEEQEKEPCESEEEVECAEKQEDEEIAMSSEEMMAKITDLEAALAEKDNIIMGKDSEIEAQSAELAELREFKAVVEKERKELAVEKVLSEVAKFMDKDTIDAFRTEGQNVEFAQFDAWANKVKASIVDSVVKSEKTNGVFAFSAPVEKEENRNMNVWDRI